ncbi:MAG: tyrosine--tRNA ligase [Pseudomonadaceae bacterium]|nr:tyrosine--tRNA ligase [Pseudomonadaceae bacterium]
MTTPASIFSDLQARGLIAQTTNGIEAHLNEAPRTLYCGFDPTADSLHIGSLIPLLTLRRFQQAGHTPIILVGGATGMIGDPSFKAQERKLNDTATIRGWVEKLQTQTSRFVDFDTQPNAARAVNNYDWTHTMDVLTFLRDVGKHFTVNNLIAKEAIKSRLERDGAGISFTEFTYPLLQGLDFKHLIEHHTCTIQLGGSDQWGNMTAGTELIRKTLGAEAHVITVPLVTKADGTKFGKTESGTIWLDATKTSPYAFYQFWLNTADADVEKFLLYFSFRSVEAIKTICEEHKENPGLRKAQRMLASDVTCLVHGEDAFTTAERISEYLFGSHWTDGEKKDLSAEDYAQLAQDGLPTTTSFTEGSIIEALTSAGLAQSNRQAREFVENGAVTHNGESVQTTDHQLSTNNAAFGRYHLLRRGKKNYALLVHA